MKVIIFHVPEREITSLLNELSGYDFSVIDDPETYGKKLFWKRFQKAVSICLESDHDWFVFLADDFRHLDLETINAWLNHPEAKKSVLNITSDDRVNCWGHDLKSRKKPIELDSYKFIDQQFFDCGGIIHRSILEKITIDEIPESWFNKPGKSSGVGYQLTRKLRKMNVPMYRPFPSLAHHGPHQSIMHPNERLKTPLISLTKDDLTDDVPVVACIATFGNRPIKRVVNSLLPQVNKIYLYNNDKNEDLTDLGKFYGLSLINERCLVLLCDDDIEYPSNYVAVIKQAIRKHKCIVSFHGRVLKGYDLLYYQGHRNIEFDKTVSYNGPLHVAGTGVTAFDTFYFHPKDLHLSEYKLMSDLVFSLEVAKQGKQIVSVPHNVGWLKQLHVERETSIHNVMRRKQETPIKLANQILKLCEKEK